MQTKQRSVLVYFFRVKWIYIYVAIIFRRIMNALAACPNHQFSRGKDCFSANHIQFSFKELENLDKENKLFYLARNYTCIFNQWQSFCYDYISDRFGFALLHLSSGMLEVYYHDTQKSS